MGKVGSYSTGWSRVSSTLLKNRNNGLVWQPWPTNLGVKIDLYKVHLQPKFQPPKSKDVVRVALDMVPLERPLLLDLRGLWLMLFKFLMQELVKGLCSSNSR